MVLRPESLLDFFPECADTYVDNCDWGEVKIPCTNLCWRKCDIEREWDGTECILRDPPDNGALTPTWDSNMLEVVKENCQMLNPDYRLPTVYEVANLLNDCNPDTFNKGVTNRCGNYFDSAIYYVVDSVNIWVDSWLGELDWCSDQYDQTTQSCAWEVRLYGNVKVETEFNWFQGKNGYLVSGAMCVREQ